MGSLKKETTIKFLMIKIVLISILTFPNSIIFFHPKSLYLIFILLKIDYFYDENSIEYIFTTIFSECII